jgi:hypothetical protein
VSRRKKARIPNATATGSRPDWLITTRDDRKLALEMSKQGGGEIRVITVLDAKDAADAREWASETFVHALGAKGWKLHIVTEGHDPVTGAFAGVYSADEE